MEMHCSCMNGSVEDLGNVWEDVQVLHSVVAPVSHVAVSNKRNLTVKKVTLKLQGGSARQIACKLQT